MYLLCMSKKRYIFICLNESLKCAMGTKNAPELTDVFRNH